MSRKLLNDSRSTMCKVNSADKTYWVGRDIVLTATTIHNVSWTGNALFMMVSGLGAVTNVGHS